MSSLSVENSVNAILNAFQAADIQLTELKREATGSNWGKAQTLLRKLSVSLYPPAPLRNKVVEVIEQTGQLTKIQSVVESVMALKNESSTPLNFAGWLAFPAPYNKRQQMLVAETSIPLLAEKLPIEMAVTDKNEVKASWKGMLTCTCTRTSPAGLDRFADQIASALQHLPNERPLLLFHMGSGGCLFDALLSSRLTRFKKIHWVLIDPLYANITGVYLLNKKADHFVPHELHEGSVHAWMQYAQTLNPQSWTVTVCAKAGNLCYQLSGMMADNPQTVTFAENFHLSQGFAEDYSGLAGMVDYVDADPLFFCHDETQQNTSQLTLSEALEFQNRLTT